jgi:DNA replication and repair protein RecF
MHIGRLYAEAFRNLDTLEWRPHRHFNLITGDNGQGKTNLLEALSVAAGLRSFRTARLGDCVRFGADKATVAVQLERQAVRVDLAVQFRASGRRLFLDGRAVSGAADYLGRLVVVLFVPSDLHLPHGEPDQRRRYLDRVVFNHDAAHLLDLRQYERVLTSRNSLLKQHKSSPVDPQMLDVYDVLLARHGAVVARRRLDVLKHFTPQVREVFSRLAPIGLEADLRYVPKGFASEEAADEATLLQALRSQRTRDLALGYTSRGPHRDDLEFVLAGRPAHAHASQGQSRTLVLALKIAEIQSLEAALGEPPVLLMDDVSSELDEHRNRALMTCIDALGGQVFLTTTDAAHIRVAAPRQILDMRAGALHPGPTFGRGGQGPTGPENEPQDITGGSE